MRPYKSAILRDYLVGNAALGVPQCLFDKPKDAQWASLRLYVCIYVIFLL